MAVSPSAWRIPAHKKSPAKAGLEKISGVKSVVVGLS
jgi:hypothetical protein